MKRPMECLLSLGSAISLATAPVSDVKAAPIIFQSSGSFGQFTPGSATSYDGLLFGPGTTLVYSISSDSSVEDLESAPDIGVYEDHNATVRMTVNTPTQSKTWTYTGGLFGCFGSEIMFFADPYNGTAITESSYQVILPTPPADESISTVFASANAANNGTFYFLDYLKNFSATFNMDNSVVPPTNPQGDPSVSDYDSSTGAYLLGLCGAISLMALASKFPFAAIKKKTQGQQPGPKADISLT